MKMHEVGEDCTAEVASSHFTNHQSFLALSASDAAGPVPSRDDFWSAVSMRSSATWDAAGCDGSVSPGGGLTSSAMLWSVVAKLVSQTDASTVFTPRDWNACDSAEKRVPAPWPQAPLGCGVAQSQA